AVLREAENCLHSRYGLSREEDAGFIGRAFAVLSLGKLGGNELNYSSDIDLFYIFSDQEPVLAITPLTGSWGEPQGPKPPMLEVSSSTTEVVPSPAVPSPIVPFNVVTTQSEVEPCPKKNVVTARSNVVPSRQGTRTDAFGSSREYFIRLAQEVTGL